ncbi:hypothetical protein M9Y10_030063 [Tritrichomonas musculus]|uniref:Uncharacterized protein n=1 Tax=Tritrichomonas musculus TaxID=1915356 RepID=A0ABR2KNU3_9EUKA
MEISRENISQIGLNIESIKDIPFEKYEKNFRFVVDGVEYQTSRIIANILSPRIRHYHFIDETINQFYINTNISSNNTHDFNKVLSLISFQKENLNENEIQYFNQISYALGNENIFRKYN